MKGKVMGIRIGNFNFGFFGTIVLLPFFALAQLISIPFRILVKLANAAERRKR